MNNCRETICSTTNPRIEIVVDSACGTVYITQDTDSIWLDGKDHVQALYEVLERILGKDA